MTPRGYLSKVLQTLAGSQIIASQRGVNGGFHLNRDANLVTAYDVVHAMDPDDQLGVSRGYETVPVGSAGRLFSGIQADVARRLQRTAIADLISMQSARALDESVAC